MNSQRFMRAEQRYPNVAFLAVATRNR